MWLVAQCNEKNLQKAVNHLKKIEIEVFYPTITIKSPRKDKNSYRIKVKPAFAGYVFINTEPASYEDILRSEHIYKFLNVDGKPSILSHETIAQLKQREFIETHPLLKKLHNISSKERNVMFYAFLESLST